MNALLESIAKDRASRPPTPPPTLSDWVGAILEGLFNLSKALLTFAVVIGFLVALYFIFIALGGDGGGAGPPDPYE